MMIIRKVRIVNFRGFINKSFTFGDKAVVLLSAANGLGKTTIVDAIEWCLTGSIGRLKSAFVNRSPNDTERKINTDGILKNSEAGEKDKVVVTLWIFDGEKEIILRREQTKDELDKDSSTATIDGNKEKAKEFCNKYVDESFYNFHFCDVQKSINIQSKKRKDMKELFSDFITNYDDQKNIADNLDIFADDVKRHIKDKTEQKKKYETDDLQRQINELQGEIRYITYPEMAFYRDEKNDISSLNSDELNTQKQCLYQCGYKKAEEKLSILVTNEKLKLKKSVISKIDSYWNDMGDSIRKALDAGLGNDTETITLLDVKLRKLKGFVLSNDTIFQDCESILALENVEFSKDDYDADKQLIKDTQNRVKEIEKDIDLLSNNNKILKIFSNLSANKQELVDYRNEELEKKRIVKCPICGSESFTTLNESLLLKETDDYIKLNGEAVSLKEKDKKLLQEKIDALYQKIIGRATAVVEKERDALEAKIVTLKALNETVQPYFDEVKKLQNIEKNIKLDELNAENVNNLLESINGQILDDSEEKILIDDYQRILAVVGYEYKDETLNQTYEKVKNLALNDLDVNNFSYDVFVSKINAINSILSNQTLLDLSKKLDDNIKRIAEIDEEIKKLNRLHDIASSRAKDIQEIVDVLSKEEYEKVGPAITKYYDKLARFNCKNGIRIIQKEDGLSLVDGKDKNIVNVLSNGQISVFMLAYFFAGISARNEREQMKIYFIDDLTACMDDVNMLAFLDLLKYQMSSKATMEQLFFVTCDDRISKLFKYKMTGHGIQLCEFQESDFL